MFTALGHIFSFISTIFSAADKSAQALDIHAGGLIISAEDSVAKAINKRGTPEQIAATRQTLIAAGVIKAPEA